MKELYISPELNLLCFAPVERLALDLDDMTGKDDGFEDEVISDDGDFDFDLF